MKHLVLVTPSIILTLLSIDAMSLESRNWFVTTTVGIGSSQIQQIDHIRLRNRPEPGATNAYSLGRSNLNNITLSIAIDEKIPLSYNDISTKIGIKASLIRSDPVTGVVHPMINNSPDFDTLNYTYSIESYLVQSKLTLIKNHLLFNLGLYLNAGLGISINRLKSYSESPPENSTASPMHYPFRNNNSISPAYSVGAGIQYHINRRTLAFIGYEFLNAGKAELKESPVQQTDNRMRLRKVYYQFLVFGITM